jgi:glutathione synthase/RimK-type ligase-like ATP-grasp enzyme
MTIKPPAPMDQVKERMIATLKGQAALKRMRKTMLFSRLRQHLPMSEAAYIDDRGLIEDAEIVLLDWPQRVPKPRIGLVRDTEHYPHWTKYRRFLENNGFDYEIYDLNAHDWIERGRQFDLVVGMVSNRVDQLEEIRVKYHFLETVLGKKTYPSAALAVLYENKCLEAFLAEAWDLPFARSFVSYRREDALAMLDDIRYPFVSKVNQSSGSMGVELVRNPRQARRIIRQAFSRRGRPLYMPWLRQKNYVYFQEFVPNDGYDIRVILIGDRAFGYFRSVPQGDFRASGMSKLEWRALPEEAVRVARQVQERVKSPKLVVDMVHALDGRYVIIEYSITCLTDQPADLIVNGVPGVYIIGRDGALRFEPGRFWVHELALRQFLTETYLSGA